MHIPCNGLVCLYGWDGGFEQFSLHVKICGGNAHAHTDNVSYCFVTLHSSIIHQYLIQVSIWKKEIRQKPVLTSEPKYTSAPGNRSACRHTEEQSRSERKLLKMSGTHYNFCKTRKNPNKTTSRYTQTVSCRHIQVKVRFIFGDDSSLGGPEPATVGSLKPTTNWAPIKWLVKTLSPLKHHIPLQW